MTSSVTVTEQDRYTVAGLLRHLARQQGDAEMLVLGAERRTWAEEFDVACRVAQAASATASASATGSPFSIATASRTSTSCSVAR